ncbi:hypothetical protein PS1_014596 [Malus domestica]
MGVNEVEHSRSRIHDANAMPKMNRSDLQRLQLLCLSSSEISKRLHLCIPEPNSTFSESETKPSLIANPASSSRTRPPFRQLRTQVHGFFCKVKIPKLVPICSCMCSVYENPYENFQKFDHDGGSDGSYLMIVEKVELYGARGTAPKSSSSTLFDDYRRSISVPSGKTMPVSSNKIVRAVPKADTQEDAKVGCRSFGLRKCVEESGQQNR